MVKPKTSKMLAANVYTSKTGMAPPVSSDMVAANNDPDSLATHLDMLSPRLVGHELTRRVLMIGTQAAPQRIS